MTLQSLARPAILDAGRDIGLRTSAASGGVKQDARSQAESFEAAFLSTMVQSMFTAIGEEGPMGNGAGAGMWRSFLTEEYGRQFAKAGGVGLADQVYSALIALQEAKSPPRVNEAPVP